MRRIVFVLVVVLVFLSSTAMATDKCNHYGCNKPKGHPVNNTANAKASAYAGAMAVSNQWLSARQSMTFNPSIQAGGADVSIGGGQFEAPKPDFPVAYAPVAPSPLDYRGPYDYSVYKDDQPWFDRSKWIADFANNLPDGGDIRVGLFEKAEPVKYFYTHDGREQEFQSAPGRMVLGKIYCQSKGPEDTPSSVWGGCARAILKGGCEYVSLVGGDVSYGSRAKAVNVGGGVSLSSIFGSLFGLTGGVGGTNTDWDASPYERVHLIWKCYSKYRPQQ